MAQKVKPNRDNQATLPTLAVGELRFWRDGTGKVWLLYRDTDEGYVRFEVD